MVFGYIKLISNISLQPFDDLTDNILNTIYRKTFFSVDITSSLNDCNNAIDPRYNYIVRTNAKNRPSNPSSEFQMFILQAIWGNGLFQLGITPACDCIVIRRYAGSANWNEWYKISLSLAN